MHRKSAAAVGRLLKGAWQVVAWASLAGCASVSGPGGALDAPASGGLEARPAVAPDRYGAAEGGRDGTASPAAPVAEDGAEPAEPPSADPPYAGARALVESPVPGWVSFRIPGKRPTLYRAGEREGRPAIHARSDRSASMLRRAVSVAPERLDDFRFSWWVPELIAGSMLGVRDTDDTPVRVVLAFDGDHRKLSMKERLQYEMAETLTGERPPYATLMYVWDTRHPRGAVVVSPRSDRIRTLVVETGETRLRRWCDYRRDVLADYRRAFGEEPGRLIAVGMMTDSDNTQSQAEAWYGEFRFRP